MVNTMLSEVREVEIKRALKLLKIVRATNQPTPSRKHLITKEDPHLPIQ